jgi:transcriptional regulator with XRE-family HTH domain
MRYTKVATEPFDPRKIGELIRRREHLGMQQRELEEKLGLSERMVAKWENRLRSPTAANLDRWAAALGLRLVFRVGK